MITSEELFNRVNELAKAKGMSLNEVSIKCGRANNFFYVFKNRNKGLNTLHFWYNVAHFLGTSLDELMKG